MLVDNKTIRFGGLTTSEAAVRLHQYGRNEFSNVKKNTVFKLFVKSFFEPLIIILVISAFVALTVAIINHFSATFRSTWKDFLNPFLIIAVVLINSILVVIVELRFQRSIALLRKVRILKTFVLRDDKVSEIPASEIVVGDIIFLHEGDQIAADAILLEANDLCVNEAIITGESHAVFKSTNSQSDQDENKVFAGCFVVKGTGVARVFSTGYNTEIGKIRRLTDVKITPKSKLQLGLNKISKYMAIAGIVLFLIIIIIEIIVHHYDLFFSNFWIKVFISATAFSVSIIPEGIVLCTKFILFLGVIKMARQNAIVKKMDVMDSISRLNVICADKTGTLTKNQMTVKGLWIPGCPPSVVYCEQFYELVSHAILCTDAHLDFSDEKLPSEIGDPTETALLLFGWKSQISKPNLLEKYPLVKKSPFNSERKFMVTVHRKTVNTYLTVVKGALESILPACTNINVDMIKKISEQWSSLSYRVIAVAAKITNNESEAIFSMKAMKNLKFLGLIGLADPLRSESYQAIQVCYSLGIKVCMITGDGSLTAKAVATNLKILSKDDLVITGNELEQLSDDQLDEEIENYTVYARVKPQDKLRIIHAWQRKNKIVAMTGDGVNDAPALKGANVGYSMGLKGTDMARDASSVILMDDNFSTIVHSVKIGRKITQKIIKMIEIALIFSVSQLFILFIGLGIFNSLYTPNFGLGIFNSFQILWLNLVSHGFLAMIVGLQDIPDHLIHRFNSQIISKKFCLKVTLRSFLIAIFTILSYIILRNGFKVNDHGVLTAGAFATYSVSIAFNFLNTIIDSSIFWCRFKFYKLAYITSIIVVLITFLLLFVPGLSNLFGFGHTFRHCGVIFVACASGFIPTLFEEGRKLILKMRSL